MITISTWQLTALLLGAALFGAALAIAANRRP
jgi:hypothetical protein